MIESQINEIAERRRQAVSRLRVFDASLWLGRPQGFPLAEEMDVAALNAAMADNFIGGGLVSHWRGKIASPQEGNAALLEAGLGEANDSLGAIMTGLPLFPREGGPLPVVGDLPTCVRAVRVFPKTHGFPLTDWVIGSLGKWMIERRLPLFVWHTEVDWQELYSFAKALPKLAIVVESQPRKIIYHLRPLLALLRDCPNTHVEISNLTGPAFELVLQHIGAERLIFGSFLPVSDPLVPLGLILDAEMSEADRTLIAGGNLRRLIGGGAA